MYSKEEVQASYNAAMSVGAYHYLQSKKQVGRMVKVKEEMARYCFAKSIAYATVLQDQELEDKAQTAFDKVGN